MSHAFQCCFFRIFCCSLFLILSHVSYATASNSDVQMLEISRPGDIDLSCHHISQEAVLMRDIISTTQEIKDGAQMKERGIGVIGAIGGLVIGSATGGLGFAAAGALANHLNNETNEEADSVQDIAAQRRFFMVGIYNAKGCFGPIEHAMYDPELTESWDSVSSGSYIACSIGPKQPFAL